MSGACWNFAKVMEVGDIVFAKQGIKKIVGYGEVTGDYLFDDKRKSFKNTRRMKWLGKGTWDLPEDIRLPFKDPNGHQRAAGCREAYQPPCWTTGR